MSTFKEHCKECNEKLGKDWDVVHIWLDSFAKTTWPHTFHRIHRHHIAGVEEVRHRWGDEAAEAAKLHILADFPDLDHIPTYDEVCNLCGVEVICYPDGTEKIKTRRYIATNIP